MLALLLAVMPVILPSQALPCNGESQWVYWVNPTAQTVHVKVRVDHQADYGLVADIHVTVWHGWEDGSRVVGIAPWDRYDNSPKPAVEVPIGPGTYAIGAGDHLAFQATCTPFLWTYSPPKHHPQYSIAYVRQSQN